jgi:hypothetical protein
MHTFIRRISVLLAAALLAACAGVAPLPETSTGGGATGTSRARTWDIKTGDRVVIHFTNGDQRTLQIETATPEALQGVDLATGSPQRVPVGLIGRLEKVVVDPDKTIMNTLGGYAGFILLTFLLLVSL